MVFQIALVAFALLAIFKTQRQFRSRQVSKYWFVVQTLFWAVVAVVAITPETTDIVARFVGVGRGADLLVYVAVITLFFLVYRLMLRQQQLSDEMTELVRHLAISEEEKRATPSTPSTTSTPGTPQV